MRIQFLEKTAGREKGTIEEVDDGIGTIWCEKKVAIKVDAKKAGKEPPTAKTVDKKATRHFAGAPLKK